MQGHESVLGFGGDAGYTMVSALETANPFLLNGGFHGVCVLCRQSCCRKTCPDLALAVKSAVGLCQLPGQVQVAGRPMEGEERPWSCHWEEALGGGSG